MDKENQKLTTTDIQQKKHTYKGLPMSIIVCTPDIFWLIMMELLKDSKYALVCNIDNILIVQKVGASKTDYMKMIEKICE